MLYVFAISHYCEKARWALDYLGVDYEARHIAPGLQVGLARRLGLANTSVPILVTDTQVIQGSTEIVDWAESQGVNGLTSISAAKEVVGLEKRVDEVVGVHIRRYYYSEALLEYPQNVKPIFSENLKQVQRVVLSVTWPLLRKIMTKRMDLGEQQGQESRQIVMAELNWLDDLLADGRRFLVGEVFSRADFAVASLLAPLVAPKEHPFYAGLVVPPRIAEDLASWQTRPIFSWVREIYRDYRSV
jgi:glutathione S-transferase